MTIDHTPNDTPPTLAERYSTAVNTSNLRVCKTCGGTEFGKSGKCKPCDKKRQAAWKAANPQKVKNVSIAYYAANVDKIKIARAAYHAANKDQVNAKLVEKRKSDPEHFSVMRKASYQRNKEKSAIRTSAYYKKNRDQISKINTAWRQRNADLVKRAGAAWNEANRERVREIKRAWELRNPEHRRLNDQNRRARLRRDGGRLSKGLSARLFKLQKGKCPCCGKPLGSNYHLDHIIPIAGGGPNTDDNIQLLRARCNIQKHSKHPVEFMQSRGFLL